MKQSSVQFSQPILTKATFEMRPTDASQYDVDLHLHRNVMNIEGKNQAVVELLVQLNKKGSTEKENTPFICEVCMQSLFSWPEELTSTQIQHLLDINATTVLLSYIRPIVASLTNASPIETYNIPFISLTEE